MELWWGLDQILTSHLWTIASDSDDGEDAINVPRKQNRRIEFIMSFTQWFYALYCPREISDYCAIFYCSLILTFMVHRTPLNACTYSKTCQIYTRRQNANFYVLYPSNTSVEKHYTLSDIWWHNLSSINFLGTSLSEYWIYLQWVCKVHHRVITQSSWVMKFVPL